MKNHKKIMQDVAKANTVKRKKVKIIIEKSVDSFSGYAENVAGIYGQGNTVEEAKKSAIEGLELFKKYNEKIPVILKSDYEIVFKFDTESFLNLIPCGVQPPIAYTPA